MNDLAKQLVKLWEQFSLFQRLTIVGAALAVVVGMIVVGAMSGRPHMVLLYGRLAEKDVAEMVAAVQAQGVKYEVGAGGTAVYVPADKVYLVRAQLASKGIPAGEGVGFEIFDRANFGISDFVQRTNYVRAVQGELSRTISQMKGVHSARVMIVMPENRLLFNADSKTKPTASVFVEEGGGALGQEQVNSIRFLVANSVEGLSPNDVAVVDSRGNVLTESLKDDPTLGSASSQIKFRKSVEDYFASKVETMLANVLGRGNSVVRVSADVDVDSATTVQEKYDPDVQVIRNEVISEDSTISNETAPANNTGPTAPVGVTANTPQNNGQNSGNTGKSSEQSRKSTTNAYEINKTTINAIKNPGNISRVSAAVFIAAKPQPRTKEELESLRKMVVSALGIKAANAQELESLVTLQEVTFEGNTEVKPNVITEVVTNYPEIFRNLAAFVIAAVVLVAFMRMLKNAKPDEIPIEILDPKAYLQSAGQGNSRVSPEMLNDLIRQKPGNVGAALRDWLAVQEKK
jgi:flagellar M-ring protein FliF